MFGDVVPTGSHAAVVTLLVLASRPSRVAFKARNFGLLIIELFLLVPTYQGGAGLRQPDPLSLTAKGGRAFGETGRACCTA